MFKFPGQLLLLMMLCCATLLSSGQDTLPGFTLINRGPERILISWNNPYGQSIRQLSVQRSFDSLRNFKSILTVPDPTAPQNGYVDTKATNDHMFYRLFILLDSGKYLFSVVKKPMVDDNASTSNYQNINTSGERFEIMDISRLRSFRTDPANANERIIFIKRKDALIGFIQEKSLLNYRRYINTVTRDTVFMKSVDTLVIQPFVAQEYFRPSQYVFTEKDGNIKIQLNDARQRKYSVRFFEEDNSEAFEINQIKEPVIIVDKANFVHAGWFNFELFDDGKLKEKHKFYVPKSF